MIVFLSGGITRNPNYKRDFRRAERKMVFAGFTPVNPVKVMSCVPLSTHEDYMRISRAWIETCDAVYMLCGWTNSDGAVEEYRHAKTIGKSILFEDGAETAENFERG